MLVYCNRKLNELYYAYVGFCLPMLLITFFLYCWFARDVTAAMVVVKNKTVSLRWELNSIFMQILRNKIVLY